MLDSGDHPSLGFGCAHVLWQFQVFAGSRRGKDDAKNHKASGKTGLFLERGHILINGFKLASFSGKYASFFCAYPKALAPDAVDSDMTVSVGTIAGSGENIAHPRIGSL